MDFVHPHAMSTRIEGIWLISSKVMFISLGKLVSGLHGLARNVGVALVELFLNFTSIDHHPSIVDRKVTRPFPFCFRGPRKNNRLAFVKEIRLKSKYKFCRHLQNWVAHVLRRPYFFVIFTYLSKCIL